MQFRAAEEDCRQAGPVGVACEMGGTHRAPRGVNAGGGNGP